VLALLRRRRQPEMLESELLKRRLQRSLLGVRWHVADLLGGGGLQRIQTAVGPLLRAAKPGG
jgi:serine/threonine-protein kinase 19